MRGRVTFYNYLIPKGSLVYDIGANIGNYSLLFSQAGAKVIAVEPQAALVSQMRDRFPQGSRVRVVHAAVGAAASTAILKKTPGLSEIASLHPDIATRSRFSAQHSYSEHERVPVVTLDQLIQEHGEPFFCKIDVEGYEREALKGLNQPLRLLSFEFNREFWPEIIDCIELVRQKGDYEFNFTEGSTPAFLTSQWMSGESLKSALSSSTDPLLWGDVYARRAN